MHDLIIVGGGPSGASAAHKAALKGLKVLLFEKEKFPRHKPCGGGVTEQALSYIGEPIPPALIENEIYGIRVKYKGRSLELLHRERFTIITSRDAFDNFLLARAMAVGAEVKVEKITDFREDNDGVRVMSKHGEYMAKFLIIAEGAHGTLKYKVRNRDNKDHYSFCITSEVEVSDGANFPDTTIEIEFGLTEMGYGWVFPRKTHYSVGIGGVARHMKDAKRKFSNYLQYHNFPLNGLQKGHMIPLGWHKRKFAGERTLLCGDAGGFVDSFSGEGIAYAIRSGQIAAEKMAEFIAEKKKPNMEAYEKACRAEFNGNLKYSYLLLKLINRFPELCFGVIFSDDKFVKLFMEIPLMKTTYKKIYFSLPLSIIQKLPLLALKNIRAGFIKA